MKEVLAKPQSDRASELRRRAEQLRSAGRPALAEMALAAAMELEDQAPPKTADRPETYGFKS